MSHFLFFLKNHHKFPKELRKKVTECQLKAYDEEGLMKQLSAIIKPRDKSVHPVHSDPSNSGIELIKIRNEFFKDGMLAQFIDSLQ